MSIAARQHRHSRRLALPNTKVQAGPGADLSLFTSGMADRSAQLAFSYRNAWRPSIEATRPVSNPGRQRPDSDIALCIVELPDLAAAEVPLDALLSRPGRSETDRSRRCDAVDAALCATISPQCSSAWLLARQQGNNRLLVAVGQLATRSV